MWSKKVSSAMTDQLRFNCNVRPGTLRAESIAHLIVESLKHGVGHIGAEKPRIKAVPKFFLLRRQLVSPAMAHVPLISMPEVIELKRSDLVEVLIRIRGGEVFQQQ